MSEIDNWTGRSPIATQTDLPYNFYSTPILGDGSNPDTAAAEFAAVVAAAQLIDPSATTETVEMAWKEYFYGFQPFVTDEFYDYDPAKLEDPDQTVDTGAYYSGLFLRKFEGWKQWQGGDGAGLSDNSFNYFLANVDDSGTRQKNVIFWQFIRVLDAVELLDARRQKAANRRVMWSESQLAATELMASYNIPKIKPSNDDARVPDPDSIRDQHNVMMDIERARQKRKTSEEKERIDDSNFTFAGDTRSMHMSSLKSFWQTMSKVLGSVINI